MSDAPIVGRHPDPSEPEPPADGVVLFDPTPKAPFDPDELGDEGSRRLHPALLFLLIGFLGVAGLQFYQGRLASGPQTAEVTPPPVQPLPIDSLRASLGPLRATQLAGPVGSTVLIEVRAMGLAGAPLTDTLVRFEVSSGEGEIQSGGRTDAAGLATALLRLPNRVGRVVVRAAVPGSELETRIPVEVHAGAPQRLVAVEGDGQSAEVGELLPTRLSVRVTDAGGNPVSGADVRFAVVEGGGVAAPSRTRTDSLGVASALWRLGMASGEQQLTASSIELPTTLTFTATALGRPTVRPDGTIVADPTPVRVMARAYAIGGSHACALLGGSAACRGANDRGQAGTRGSGLVALTTGVAHTCALDDTGAAVCWGANEGGQLGDGSRSDRSSPIPVRTELRFSALTAGASHTCGLAGGGLPVCWGENLSGQLGDGSRTDARFPRAVGGGLTFGTLVAGWNHTCGLTANRNAFCWGLNSDGQLGDGSRLDRLVPTLVRGGITSLVAGSAHTCGIDDDDVVCWGDNRFGQLGDGTNEGRAQPVAVQGLPSRPRSLAAGAVHTCALLPDGSVYCWGQNLHGQIGDGTTQNRNRASAVAGNLRFSSLEAGGALACGFATDGGEYCWGLNQSGQLGDGTRESRSSPTRVNR